MKTDYTIKLEKMNGPDDTPLYVAFCEELGSGACCGQGKTPNEAIQDFEENKEVYLEQLNERGMAIPEPLPSEESLPSGVFTVRLARQLHGILAKQAKLNKVSLNAYVQQLLSYQAGAFDVTSYVTDQIANIKDNVQPNSAQLAQPSFVLAPEEDKKLEAAESELMEEVETERDKKLLEEKTHEDLTDVRRAAA